MKAILYSFKEELLTKKSFAFQEIKLKVYDGATLKFRLSEQELNQYQQDDQNRGMDFDPKDREQKISQEIQSGPDEETSIPSLTEEKLDVSKVSQEEQVTVTLPRGYTPPPPKKQNPDNNKVADSKIAKVTLPPGYTPPPITSPPPKKQNPDNNKVADSKIAKNNEDNLTDPSQITTTGEAVTEVIEMDKEVIARGASSTIEEQSELKEKPKEREINIEDRKINNDLREGAENLLDQQKQQQGVENIQPLLPPPSPSSFSPSSSNISNTTDKANENIDDYKSTNKEIIVYKGKKDTTHKYQQENINNPIQQVSNNYAEAQNSSLYTYQPVFLKFLDDVYKSYWKDFRFPERYYDVYNKTNQDIIDNTVNNTSRLNELILGSIETFNKSFEIAQKYYYDAVQNYFNFVNKIAKSSYNH